MQKKYKIIVKKDCFGKNRYEYQLKSEVDERFIRFLKTFGEVSVFRDFTIPLIKMDIDKGIRLNALLGSNSLDISFKGSRKCKQEFEKRLNNFLS